MADPFAVFGDPGGGGGGPAANAAPRGPPLSAHPTVAAAKAHVPVDATADALLEHARAALLEDAEDVVPAVCAWLEADGLRDVAVALHMCAARFLDADAHTDANADDNASLLALDALTKGDAPKAGEHWQIAVAFPALAAAYGLLLRDPPDAARALALADRCDVLGTALVAHRVISAASERLLVPADADADAGADIQPFRTVAPPPPATPSNADPVPEEHGASYTVAAFHVRTQTTDAPFVIRDCAFARARDDDAPLVTPKRLRRGAFGARVVPVELGVREGGGGNATMSLRELVDAHLAQSLRRDHDAPPPGVGVPPDVPPDGCRVAYLAQSPLFAQIPSLAEGLEASPYVPHHVKSVNAWIGTSHTVTALHSDSDDNLLVQLRGFKWVVLYAPHEAQNVYATVHPRAAAAGVGGAGQFSAVRVEHPDYDKHPRFRDARGLACMLSPGDALYIPRGWFHYVRALTTSVSINYWW